MDRRAEMAALVCLRQFRQAPARRMAIQSIRAFSTSESQRATVATSGGSLPRLQLPADHVPATKPPSARPIEDRKSQMIRTYTSLLRTTPLILFFQHSNLTAEEWAAVRRELKASLEAVPASPGDINISPHINLQVVRTNMMRVALKLVELYNPEVAAASATTPRTSRGPVTHDLSQVAYDTMKSVKVPTESSFAQLEPLLVGPVAALVFPSISSAHLAAALRILSPVPGRFPAPTRKKNPGYYDPTCQNALAKLLLVGGRVEGRVFDQAGVNWVGGIEGGIDGLRAQLVHTLQGAGLGLTSVLGGASSSLWLTLEGRKEQLDSEEKKE